MERYRQALPQLSGGIFLTDGGLETTLIYHDCLDLPEFAAFDLLNQTEGREALWRYFESYAALAVEHSVGFILESATWRANPDWGKKLGYSPEMLDEVNRESIRLLDEVREVHASEESPMVISGCVGPRGDGYDPSHLMTPDEAAEYHGLQIGTFNTTDADMITAITMPYADEAAGIARAAASFGMPSVISFTVETDGRLPTGQPLGEAIEQVDDSCEVVPAYYMINCAHPSHFAATLADGAGWVERIRGIRANASTLSHAELDNATELDDGNPVELANQYRALIGLFPHINVLGGCCGTDQRHIEEICRTCLPQG